LSITVRNEQIFISQNTSLPITEQGFTVLTTIPKQKKEFIMTDIMEMAVKTTLMTTVAGNIAINVGLRASLNYLWGMINAM